MIRELLSNVLSGGKRGKLYENPYKQELINLHKGKKTNYDSLKPSSNEVSIVNWHK